MKIDFIRSSVLWFVLNMSVSPVFGSEKCLENETENQTFLVMSSTDSPLNSLIGCQPDLPCAYRIHNPKRAL